jgi:hypothetical protein
MAILPILLAVGLVSPQFRNPSDLHFTKIPTNDIIKGEYVNMDLSTQYPKYSNYDSFVIVGANMATEGCLQGKAFEDKTLRMENLFWLSEAFAERYNVSYNFSAGNGYGVFGTSFRNYSAFNNPISSQKPVFVKKIPEDTSKKLTVSTYVNGAWNEEQPSEEMVILFLGGDLSNPCDNYFEKLGEIPPNSPLRWSDTTTRMFKFLTEFKEGCSPRVSGDVHYSEYVYSDKSPKIEILDIGYNVNHQPNISSVPSDPVDHTERGESSAIQLSFQFDKTKERFQYADVWNDSAKIYTEVTQGNVYLREDRTQAEELIKAKIWVNSGSSEDIAKAGGYNRLISMATNNYAVHVFFCKYSWHQHVQQSPTDNNDPLEYSEEKLVYILDNTLGAWQLGRSIDDNNVSFSTNFYYAPVVIGIESTMRDAFAAAFPPSAGFIGGQYEAFGTCKEPDDPAESNAAQMSEAIQKYGGSMSTISTKYLYQSVVYEGVWYGGKFLRFRTFPIQED